MSTTTRTETTVRGWRRAGVWLDERLGLSGLRYAVPEHANSLPYLLGGITFLAFLF